MDYLVLTKVSGMILGPISLILGSILNLLFNFTSLFGEGGIGNIGISIILFTFVIKLVMFPMTINQQKSSKMMAVMQPEIQAIQNKYKGKNDNESMSRMNIETKAVYEKYGTSMTAGCLPLLIQLPILFALYRVIYSVPAYVTQVKDQFLNVVFSITGVTSVNALSEGAADALVQFATDHSVTMTGINAIGDLTGVSGEALANKMVDILYKLNVEQWGELAETFSSSSDVILENSVIIERMNSFFGMSLSMTPFNGSFVPNIAWCIPILAGLTQWYSARLMMANQSTSKNDEDNPSAQMMKSMNITMPLMSVFFCFTFPVAIGIYWVASAAFQVVQQVIVNVYLKKIDIDDLVAKNMEKANKKRAKKGLPPQKINTNASATIKNMQAAQEREEMKRSEKIENSKRLVEESTSYYNKNAKPGSLAAKANMVAMYNEKHEKKK